MSAERMKEALTAIQNGQFAKDWIKENEDGQPRFKQLRAAGEAHEIEQTGTHLRSLMPWIKKRDLGGSQADYA